MKVRDVIGLGCDDSVFQNNSNAEPANKEEFFVFRLIKIPTDISIEISDDEDVASHLQNNGSICIFRTIASVSISFDSMYMFKIRNIFAGMPSTSIAAVNNAAAIPDIQSSPPTPLADDENQDDNELIYSQQVMMEIKKEVSYSEEIITLDDDFTICIDDSSDDESKNWAGKLSQDQDFVVQKVIESEKKKKRKAVKQIEAIPLAPPKKVRRNSIASNVTGNTVKTGTKTAVAAATTIEIPSKQAAIVKIEPTCASTTNGEPIKSTAHASHTPVSPHSINEKEKFFDHLDPFAKIQKKSEKPKTFEDALAFNAILPKKIRTAHRSKPSTATATSRKLVSILRKKNGIWPSELVKTNGERTKLSRRVKFSEAPDMVREFEPNDDENGEIIISLPTKPIHSTAAQLVAKSNSFENDPLHEIITDITEWKPEWLAQKTVPPINGVNEIVYPLIDSYVSFDCYKK